MLQVKGLGSTIRGVLASGTARFGATGSSATPPSTQAQSPDAARVAAAQRSTEGTEGAAPFQTSQGSSKGDLSLVDRNKSRTPVVQDRSDASGDGEKAVPLPNSRSLGGAYGAEKGGGLGGKGQGTAFQAQRIAQEVIPEEQGQTGARDEPAGAVQGFSALARRVAANLYGFVRDAVGRSSGVEGGKGSTQVLFHDGYPGRVDLEV
ncbi:MAG: hypothetical protein K9H25_16000 [Rhodospirillum sp.]|nr:hypothetical protein [Rhodospirillum sp.]MCF8490923.1 hypothetical protein [Rhodospirillum sp.]MCF8499074.1 hypothetical protein [Rhodospirillum sp.]